MKDTAFRICNAAIGRIFIKLIETAEGAEWDFAQLGRTITALKGFMTDAGCTAAPDVDRTTYMSLCEQVNASEARSQRARERWQRKMGITVQSSDISVITKSEKPVVTIAIPVAQVDVAELTPAEPVVVPEETAATPIEPEPTAPEPEEQAAETGENKAGSGLMVPPGLKWTETIAVVDGRVELPPRRPIYYDDVPRHLREIGVESYEEYLRHKLYREGVRGNELENKICLYADRLAIVRKNETER